MVGAAIRTSVQEMASRPFLLSCEIWEWKLDYLPLVPRRGKRRMPPQDTIDAVVSSGGADSVAIEKLEKYAILDSEVKHAQSLQSKVMIQTNPCRNYMEMKVL
ncbi:hypothetical protein M6B38_223150 [Iris pallida]|uniref:Uncharacterized protein n=1 Tax=Iris pallida TaxID=29817 RepID=A0AAX6DWZ8_IRIPA|nr:hypothetical protein M6B38_223150 [Iris pallida]